MASPPVRIDQVIPSIVERDAVSGHTLEAQQVLRSLGFVSEIFAGNWGPGLNGRVRPIAELPREQGRSQWICYQGSIGSPVADVVVEHPGPKIVNYHNITPAELVERWMPPLGDEVRLGRRQLMALAPVSELGIGVSAYNAAELDAWGYRATVVAPLMAELAPDIGLDASRRRRLEIAKDRGGSDWLFVGQMLPHKAHQDVIKAFACFRRLYDPDARLHLVGRPSCGSYALAVRRFAEEIGVAAAVEFAGSVTAAELAAFYLAADVFVCCSDHEGFCAPLLEAMHHGVPVVAYGVAAVPETVLGAGLVLPGKDPLLVAAAAHRAIADTALREALVDRARARAAQFSLPAARAAFSEAVTRGIAAAL